MPRRCLFLARCQCGCRILHHIGELNDGERYTARYLRRVGLALQNLIHFLQSLFTHALPVVANLENEACR